MIVSTGPDMRPAVQLNNGHLVTGSRKHVLKAAVYAWREKDIGVLRWVAPGVTETIREQRVESLERDYRNAL
jgi:hypothetical protein